jgi:hypothetical protein
VPFILQKHEVMRCCFILQILYNFFWFSFEECPLKRKEKEKKKEKGLEYTTCKILGNAHQIFRSSLVSRNTRIQIYNIFGRPTLLYSSEL